MPFFVFCRPEFFSDIFQTLCGDARICSLVLISRSVPFPELSFYSHLWLSSQYNVFPYFSENSNNWFSVFFSQHGLCSRQVVCLCLRRETTNLGALSRWVRGWEGHGGITPQEDAHLGGYEWGEGMSVGAGEGSVGYSGWTVWASKHPKKALLAFCRYPGRGCCSAHNVTSHNPLTSSVGLLPQPSLLPRWEETENPSE